MVGALLALAWRIAFFEFFADLLAELRRILIAVDRCPVLDHCFQKLFLGIGGDTYGTLDVTRKIPTVDVFASHFLVLSEKR
jgi:hypothetical protein